MSNRWSVSVCFLIFFWKLRQLKQKECMLLYLNGVFKYLPLKGVHFSLVQDMEQFYELWLKSQKNEKSDDAASQPSKENGKQIHMPTDYAEVTVSTAGRFPCLCFQAFLFFPSFSQIWLPRSQLAYPPPSRCLHLLFVLAPRCESKPLHPKNSFPASFFWLWKQELVSH